MKLELLDSQSVLNNLTSILYYITPAIDRSKGRYEPGDVISLVLSGNMQCWCARADHNIIAVCITQFLNFPRRRVLSIPFAGGTGVDDWLDLVDDIIEWGKGHGCKEVELYDARGGAWQRKLGWERRYITIGKSLDV